MIGRISSALLSSKYLKDIYKVYSRNINLGLNSKDDLEGFENLFSPKTIQEYNLISANIPLFHKHPVVRFQPESRFEEQDLASPFLVSFEKGATVIAKSKNQTPISSLGGYKPIIHLLPFCSNFIFKFFRLHFSSKNSLRNNFQTFQRLRNQPKPCFKRKSS